MSDKQVTPQGTVGGKLEPAFIPKGLIPTDQPDLFFEENAVGRLKKEVWDMTRTSSTACWPSTASPPQRMGQGRRLHPDDARHKLVENRRKNDVVFIPVGCTENHGMHLPSATDTLFVSMICEGVRRYTEEHAPGTSTWPCRPSTTAPTLPSPRHARHCHRPRARRP